MRRVIFLVFFDRADLKIMSSIGRGPKRIGADDVIRTHDPHITNVLLYQLSYIGKRWIIKRQPAINKVLASLRRWIALSLKKCATNPFSTVSF